MVAWTILFAVAVAQYKYVLVTLIHMLNKKGNKPWRWSFETAVYWCCQLLSFHQPHWCFMNSRQQMNLHSEYLSNFRLSVTVLSRTERTPPKAGGISFIIDKAMACFHCFSCEDSAKSFKQAVPQTQKSMSGIPLSALQEGVLLCTNIRTKCQMLGNNADISLGSSYYILENTTDGKLNRGIDKLSSFSCRVQPLIHSVITQWVRTMKV